MALNSHEFFYTIFFFFCIHVPLYFHQTFAQPRYVEFSCSNEIGNYKENSTFQSNLNTILTSAASNVNQFGFYNATAGQPGTDDQVNAMAYCRGDIDINSCRDCVKIAANNITIVCPNKKEAIGWYEWCMFRYSNRSILGIMTLDPVWNIVNPQNASNINLFTQEVNLLANNLISQAYNGTFRKFAAGKSNNPNIQTIYGYMQCTPDITPSDCMSCLNSTARGMSDCCSDRVGARYETPSCTFHYEPNNFLNLSSFPLPPPPPAAVAPSSTSTPPPLATSSTSTGTSSKSNTIIIIVCVVVALLVLILAVCVLITRRRWLNAMRRKTLKEEEEMEAMGGTETRQYDFALVRAATDNFSLANKLGRGGFGDVYKGVLSNGKEIAVKRLSKTSGQGEKEFKNEVMLVAKLQHKCLVRLLGFCLEKTERLLVYEFLSNGSLDKVLFDKVKRSRLDWEKRYRIIQSIAKGLLYLHEDSRLRIIHRDLKASNILLDDDMNAKISDFGMARLFGLDESQANTNRIAGTYGYMAPEYAMHGLLSVKSDVYSYGVLLLEIVSGKRNYSSLTEERVEDLLSYAYNTWRQGEASNLIDPTLKAHSDSLEMIVRCVHIALLCVQENVGSRPTMASVVLMLQSITLTLPTPSEPGFFSNTGIITPCRSSHSEFPESSRSSSQFQLWMTMDRVGYEFGYIHTQPIVNFLYPYPIHDPLGIKI